MRADAAHVASYGEAGFVYRVSTQAEASARAVVLKGAHSEAEARRVMRSENYSPQQIEAAFAEPEPPEPSRRLAEEEAKEPEPEACPVGSTRRRLPETGQGSCVRLPRTAEVVAAAQAGAKAKAVDNSGFMLAAGLAVAVLVYKNM